MTTSQPTTPVDTQPLHHCMVTDLDSTLVFTGNIGTPNTVCVDTYSGGRGGLMTKNAYHQYQLAAKTGTLIALTTRTLAEYSRMDLPQLRYVLVANGTRLIINGVEHEPWRQDSLSLISHLATPTEVHRNVANTLAGEPVKTACCDAAFIVVAISRQAIAETDRIEQALPTIPGYVRHRVGRKIYLLPSALDKAAMLQRLWDITERPSRVHAAGDSSMDSAFLQAADRGVVPACADLAQTLHNLDSITVTAARGVDAGTNVMDHLAQADPPAHQNPTPPNPDETETLATTH